MSSIEQQIREMVPSYAADLKQKMDDRLEEMQTDNPSHLLIYRVLGISHEEGHLIDIYQNKGRLLYNAAGRFLEEVTKRCFLAAYPDSGSVRVPNTRGQRPNMFEIDCLVGSDAIEIKWRDATTDGDHVTKEHTRISAIVDTGFTPVRIMFFYLNRVQAIRIQETLATLYIGVGDAYYFGDSAWDYVFRRTNIPLKTLLEKLAAENMARLS